MREISSNSNLMDVIPENIDGDLQISNQLLCDGKVKASFLVKHQTGKQHILEIVEDEIVHFSQADGTLGMRQKARLADKIAKEHGYSGYSAISFVELDNAQDERQMFDQINQQIA